MNNKVSYEEQIEQGLVRRRSNFTTPAPQPIVRKIDASLQQTAHVIDVAPTATQHVEMKTSAVDRALGFLIANVPLFGAFALVVVLAAINLHSSPLLSWFAFNVFWVTFTLSWLISYVVTLAISAEGVAFFEAWMKWRIISREQDRRWEHYNRTNGGE